MKRLILLLVSVCVTSVLAEISPAQENSPTAFLENVSSPQETHLTNVRQLTTKQGAEAYFSFDNQKIIFQSTRDGRECDQMFTINVDGTDLKLVSNGNGQTTCGHFSKDGTRIIYASTHAAGEDCPPKATNSVWRFSEGFDVYSANPDGSDLKRLTNTYGYDAEATVSPDGTKIVFTSFRNGDPDIYVMNMNSSDVKQLTFEKGDDGGAWFSPDNTKITYRCFHPKTLQETKDWDEALSKNEMGRFPHEICMMDADGSNKRQITNFGRASWAPYFHPNGKQIIFSSNRLEDEPWNFELYLINLDGTGLERITYNSGFDGFPMFSYDGRKLVFVSMRNSESFAQGIDNVFVADWTP